MISCVLGFFALRVTKDENPSSLLCYCKCYLNDSRCGLYRHMWITMLYSGFSHFCFWQCSDNRLTGSLPVHEWPPMICLTVGLGAAGARLSFEGPGFFFLSLVKMSISSSVGLLLLSLCIFFVLLPELGRACA